HCRGEDGKTHGASHGEHCLRTAHDEPRKGAEKAVREIERTLDRIAWTADGKNPGREILRAVDLFLNGTAAAGESDSEFAGCFHELGTKADAGKDVAARAACRDEDVHAHVRRPPCCRERSTNSSRC